MEIIYVFKLNLNCKVLSVKKKQKQRKQKVSLFDAGICGVSCSFECFFFCCFFFHFDLIPSEKRPPFPSPSVSCLFSMFGFDIFIWTTSRTWLFQGSWLDRSTDGFMCHRSIKRIYCNIPVIDHTRATLSTVFGDQLQFTWCPETPFGHTSHWFWPFLCSTDWLIGSRGAFLLVFLNKKLESFPVYASVAVDLSTVELTRMKENKTNVTMLLARINLNSIAP